MSRLGWLVSLLLGRRPDTEFIRDDLQELYVRDRAKGISLCRAYWRYVRRLAASCLSVWTAHRATWMDDVHVDGMAQDLRFALRLFRKHQTSTGIALVGLAVAIAVAVSVFTVVDAVMLRSYGMDDPDSVVSIDEPRHRWPIWPYSSFLKLQEASTLLRIEASLSPRVRFSAVPTPGTESNRRTRFISGGYLAMLGGRPMLGRPIGPHDDLAGAPPVIMVSHQLWAVALGADPAAIGRTMWLNGTPVTLVGVMSPEFTGPSKSGGPAIWAPIAAYDVLGGKPLTRASNELVEVVARLVPGTSPRAAEEQLTLVVDGWNGPAASGERRKVRIESAASPVSGRNATEAYLTILFIFGIVGLVLAVACANTANLLLAAATARQVEMGTRLALGATPARLFRQTLSESLLLSAVAGGLGFALSIWFVPVLREMLDLPLELPAEVATRPDGRALVFTMAVGLVCGLGAGVSPARYGARGYAQHAVRSQISLAGGRVMPRRLRSSFVGFQAAVSIFLLIAAALLGRSVMRSMSEDAGFDADRLLTIAVSRGGPPGYHQSAVEVIRTLPTIEAVSVSQYEPYGSFLEREFLSQGGRVYQVNVARADADYFRTLGLRIVRGRAFGREEVAREAPIALISESVATAFYEGIDPIGQSLSRVARGGTEEERATIVGIVADAQLSPLWSERSATIYRPISAKPDNPPSLIVRARLPSLTRFAIRGVEDALKRVDPLNRPRVSIVQDEFEEYLGSKRMLSSLSAPIALLAAILATVGVFGVSAFAVGQRTAEISVRMALGASAQNVCRMLIVDSLRPTVIGLIAGVAAALIASRGFASLIGGISPHDPLSILTAVGTLMASSLVAVALPVRRAARTDVASLLRAG
jgi:putative ABC transport system permease protein